MGVSYDACRTTPRAVTHPAAASGPASSLVHMQVHAYSMFGQRLPRHFSLGATVRSEGIAGASIAGNVLVAQTVNGGICTAAACCCRIVCVHSSRDREVQDGWVVSHGCMMTWRQRRRSHRSERQGL